MSKTGVIIVAGGSGTRMGGILPKQFMTLGNATILEITLRRFLGALPDSPVVVVLPAAEILRWEGICTAAGLVGTHTVCRGGANRFESVRSGLSVLGDCEFIAVHDGVRPLVTARLIRVCLDTARKCGTAVPAVKPVDSFRTEEGETSRPIDRERLRAVQTPQVFRADILRRAYAAEYNPAFTDDASVVEASGTKVTLCEGERGNIKITTPEDLTVAGALLGIQPHRNAVGIFQDNDYHALKL